MNDRADASQEAALVVLVPEVEDLVGRFRQEYDPSAALGVPAHITINYPFLPGVREDESLYRRLTALFAEAAPFEFHFRRVARLRDLVYLPPEPEAPFRRLIDLVAGYFPESPPYGGVYERVVPHLTIAESDDDAVLGSVESQIGPLLAPRFPIWSRAERVWLIHNLGGPWQHRASFPLGVD
jgi:2'-5' RNA ligase